MLFVTLIAATAVMEAFGIYYFPHRSWSEGMFTTRLASVVSPGPEKQQYAVWPDGQRFLMNVTTEEQVATPITLILNWKPKQ
jgi:hypothetical protein